MAITYTSNKNFSIPSSGYNNWNVPIDLNWTSLDQMGGSSFPIQVGTGGTTALSNSTPSSSGVFWWDAQQFTVTTTSTLTSNAVITLPANITGSGTMGGAWIVVNGITAAQSKTDFVITALPTSGNSTFTLGAAAPANGTVIVLSTTGVLPGNFSTNVEYYLINKSGNTFQLADTSTSTTALIATSTTPYSGTATATANYTLTVKPASGTGVIINPETKGYVYYNGTSVNFADDNIVQQFNSVSGGFTSVGPMNVTGQTTISDTVTLSATNTPNLKLYNIVEDGLYGVTTWASTFNYDLLSQSVWYNTTAAASTFTINIRGNSNVVLSSVIPNTGDLVTCVYIINCGSATTLSLPSASCTGTTLTTTGSPALTVGTTITSSGSVSLGTIVSGSANTWTVSIGGTYASQTMTATFPVPYCSTVQVDGTGTGVTTLWQGGAAPTGGTPNQKNSYTFTVMRTGSTSYTVLASVVTFA